jgi:hypothetical protein
MFYNVPTTLHKLPIKLIQASQVLCPLAKWILPYQSLVQKMAPRGRQDYDQ